MSCLKVVASAWPGACFIVSEDSSIADAIVAKKKASPETHRAHPEAPDLDAAHQFHIGVADMEIARNQRSREQGFMFEGSLDREAAKRLEPTMQSMPAT